MTPLRRWAPAALAAATWLLATGCATMQVHSYTQRDHDFSRYQTYGWAPQDELRTGDPRLDNNPFFMERLQADVDRGLAGRGLEKPTSGSPDLVVYYHVNITQEVNPNRPDTPYAYASDCPSCEPYVYDAGTLLLDLVDRRTNTLVWRGWAEGTMDNAIDNQALMERRIDESIQKILATLPRDL